MTGTIQAQSIWPIVWAYPDTAAIQLENTQFYLGNIQLINGQEVVYEVQPSHFLISLNDPSTHQLAINTQLEFDHIQIEIGVDSLTHLAGAMEGALDPMHGMYWTWQSGYIHLKIEGTSPACPTRNNRFQYHLGGYKGPFKSIQTIQLPVQNLENIAIQINLDRWFESLDVSSQHTIMTPSAASVNLAKAFAHCIHLITPHE